MAYELPTHRFQAILSHLLPPGRSLPWGSPVPSSLNLYGAGESSLLLRPCVSVIGSRKATLPGLRLATTISWALSRAGVVIVSGLAKGIDAAAHRAALSCDGLTVGVLGTGLDRAYPATNAKLQSILGSEHLLLSQFPEGATVRPGNFPRRNQLMAALSDATVIIQAAEGSGTLHQARACMQLGRPLFLPRSLVEDASLTWPEQFLELPGVVVFDHPDQILETTLSRLLSEAV